MKAPEKHKIVGLELRHYIGHFKDENNGLMSLGFFLGSVVTIQKET